jgi:hypothetical protein
MVSFLPACDFVRGLSGSHGRIIVSGLHFVHTYQREFLGIPKIYSATNPVALPQIVWRSVRLPASVIDFRLHRSAAGLQCSLLAAAGVKCGGA